MNCFTDNKRLERLPFDVFWDVMGSDAIDLLHVADPAFVNIADGTHLLVSALAPTENCKLSRGRGRWWWQVVVPVAEAVLIIGCDCHFGGDSNKAVRAATVDMCGYAAPSHIGIATLQGFERSYIKVMRLDIFLCELLPCLLYIQEL